MLGGCIPCLDHAIEVFTDDRIIRRLDDGYQLQCTFLGRAPCVLRFQARNAETKLPPKRQRDVDLRVPKAVRRIVVRHELADQLAVFLDRNKCDGANTLLGNRCLQRVRKVRRLDILEIDRPRMLVVSCPG